MATGRDLPEMCRDTFPRPVSRLMWVQAELVAIATDLAEVIGGAIALNLLFGIPLFTGGLITGVVAFALLALQRRGYRPFELAIAGLLGVILLGFFTTVLRIDVPVGSLAAGLVPRFDGTESLLLATGILGATVMPHVIYLHSALTKQRILPRNVEERRFLLRRQQIDVVLGMGLAGLVNASMLIIAATLFFGSDVPDTDTLEGVHAGLAAVVDQPAAFAFALALLASGFASSGVGTYAGQVVMQGFIQRSIPLFLRRALTLTPALVVLGIGIDPDPGAGALPGGAVVRHPVRAGAAGAADPAPRPDGGAGQPAHHHGRRRGGRRPDHRPERLPDLADGRGQLAQAGAAGHRRLDQRGEQGRVVDAGDGPRARVQRDRREPRHGVDLVHA